MSSKKNRDTYLKLRGSINDASWEDKYRTVHGENRSIQERQV